MNARDTVDPDNPIVLVEVDQLVGIPGRQRRGIQRIDDAEHGGVRADPEGQDRQCEQGEPPVAHEPPRGVSRVAGEGIHQPQAPRVPTFVLRLVDPTESE